MHWPFTRRRDAAAPGAASVAPSRPGGAAAPEPTAPASGAAPRRDWATLAPIQVAGARPIPLTAQSLVFTDQLASRREVLRTARITHVRHVDAPSGTLRGVLTASLPNETSTDVPPLHAASALPSVEHRRVGVAAHAEPGVHAVGDGAVAQLLAIDGPAATIDPEQGTPAARSGEASPHVASASLPDTDVIVVAPDPTPAPASHRPSGRPTLADSRRRGLGPAYHGDLPEAMRAERERIEPLPPDLRATLHDVLGVDVGGDGVRRGPQASADAAAMGATAFARDGEVHLGGDVGPLDTSAARSTVAHEMTHVAQQRALPTLPDESSPTGQRLEAAAQRVEQYVRGDASAPKPAPAEALLESTRETMRELIESGVAEPDGQGGILFTMPPASMGPAMTQRQTATAPPATTPGAAADRINWNPAESFFNEVGQGLANDVLSIAGSAFGLSDELIGHERDELADANREFERDQTRHAFKELRMEHLRSARLRTVHEHQDAAHTARSSDLDEQTVRDLRNQVEHEVAQRLRAIEDLRAEALETVNRARAQQSQTALEQLPDTNYDRAFHLAFDHPEAEALPTRDALMAALADVAATAPRPGGTHPPTAATAPGHPLAPGATQPVPPTGTTPGTSTTAPPAHPVAPAAATSAAAGTAAGAAAARSTGTGAVPPGGTRPAPGAESQHVEEWERSDGTVGSRFEAIGAAFAHDEMTVVGSFLGLSDGVMTGLHSDIEASRHPATAATSATSAAAAPAAPTTPAATAAGAHEAAHHGSEASSHPASGRDSVEHIVNDPYALADLATRIYPTIRSRLRQELLIDRERAGLLTDFR